MEKVFIAGGAGFIGSHITRRILKDPACQVTIYDNFSSGKEWHLADQLANPLLKIIRADLKDLPTLTEAMAGHDRVFLFASNPDIAKAMTQPDIDFWEGTYLTQNVIEAMRVNQVKKILYASGSGIYGDTKYLEVTEDHSPLLPISTYGASKLAGEALICSYCHMFDISGRAYRFANVVGPNQTHGVAYDFIHKLRKDPHHLSILGDGSQSKSYIYVEDIIDAILLADKQSKEVFDYFNVATDDYITVKEIADIVVDEMGLSDVEYQFSGGDRGWKGDVPIVRFNLQKIHSLGWRSKLTSQEAIRQSVRSMLTTI